MGIGKSSHQGLGFLVPFINRPLWSSIPPSFAFPPTQSTTTTLTPQLFVSTMSPSSTPIIPSAPFSSLSSQATLENGFDHLRDWSSDGGYMRYGSQVLDSGITYAQVRGWD